MVLEGIIAKRKDGLYAPEETSWVKIKNPACSQSEGRGDWFERRASSVSAATVLAVECLFRRHYRKLRPA